MQQVFLALNGRTSKRFLVVGHFNEKTKYFRRKFSGTKSFPEAVAFFIFVVKRRKFQFYSLDEFICQNQQKFGRYFQPEICGQLCVRSNLSPSLSSTLSLSRSFSFSLSLKLSDRYTLARTYSHMQGKVDPRLHTLFSNLPSHSFIIWHSKTDFIFKQLVFAKKLSFIHSRDFRINNIEWNLYLTEEEEKEYSICRTNKHSCVEVQICAKIKSK